MKIAPTALEKVKAVYTDLSHRARELKAEDKKVIGYMCAYPPLEMLTALEMVPFRILGDSGQPVSKADACLPSVVCPFVRSSLDLALKGKYDFLDGVLMAHSCDVVEKTAHIWNIYLKPDFFHFIDVPHSTHDAAVTQHRDLLLELKEVLEKLAERPMTNEVLKKTIKAHNRQRALVRQLYDLRKASPPPISGVETLKVIITLMSLPISEGNQLLQEVIEEVKKRKSQDSDRARLLLWGSILDSGELLEMVENLDADLVMDDICTGSRFFWPDVEETDNPLDGLAKRYLVDLKCPRTFRQRQAGYQASLENRFGYLRDYAENWQVDGALLQSLRYCDIHGYEVPAVKDYFNSIGLPSLFIEYGYSKSGMAQLRTRVQAFLETLDGR